MSQSHQSASFICQHCRTRVPLSAWGTKNRNHCPQCLWSVHIDEKTGDRQSKCQGLMAPIGLTTKAIDQELMIVHQCQQCGKINKNRLAGDDDNEAILALVSAESELTKNQSDQLKSTGISLCADRQLVSKQLFGQEV